MEGKKRKNSTTGTQIGSIGPKPILLNTVLDHPLLAISGALGLRGGRGAERLGWFLAMASFPSKRVKAGPLPGRALQGAEASGRGSPFPALALSGLSPLLLQSPRAGFHGGRDRGRLRRRLSGCGHLGADGGEVREEGKRAETEHG